MGLLQQLRAFAAHSLHALVALVVRLLLVDTICVYVCEWMAHFYLVSKKAISKPDSGKREDWDCLLKGYTSISDLAATNCYKNLIELYPNAKVILNIRDASKWYKSFSETILKMNQMILPLGIHTCSMEVLFKDMLKGKEKDKEVAMHMYNLHTKEVKAHVWPKSRLLVYEIGENTKGWAPLCEFLEVEAPLVPFPHSNDSKSFQNFTFFMKTIRNIVVGTYFGILAFIAFFMMKLLG